jgi:holo-[acyl-carrier protein] synthase
MSTAIFPGNGTTRSSVPAPAPASASASDSGVIDAAVVATGQLVRAIGGDWSGAEPADWSSGLRVGVDLVAVADIVSSVQRFGDRYVRRIFTAHEIASCGPGPMLRHDHPDGADDGYAYESLAARFAAKEATIKVLRPEGPRPEWRSIEVHRAENGSCEVRLSGLAADLADQAGIDQLAVSLTHEASVGVAVVVATCAGYRGQDVNGRGWRTATLPRTDQPQTDQPQADQPQADQPQADQPQADQPQADQPQADQPQADQQRTGLPQE